METTPLHPKAATKLPDMAAYGPGTMGHVKRKNTISIPPIQGARFTPTSQRVIQIFLPKNGFLNGTNSYLRFKHSSPINNQIDAFIAKTRRQAQAVAQSSSTLDPASDNAGVQAAIKQGKVAATLLLLLSTDQSATLKLNQWRECNALSESGASWIQRLRIKSGGKVLEDIDDYNVLDQIITSTVYSKSYKNSLMGTAAGFQPDSVATMLDSLGVPHSESQGRNNNSNPAGGGPGKAGMYGAQPRKDGTFDPMNADITNANLGWDGYMSSTFSGLPYSVNTITADIAPSDEIMVNLNRTGDPNIHNERLKLYPMDSDDSLQTWAQQGREYQIQLHSGILNCRKYLPLRFMPPFELEITLADFNRSHIWGSPGKPIYNYMDQNGPYAYFQGYSYYNDGFTPVLTEQNPWWYSWLITSQGEMTYDFGYTSIGSMPITTTVRGAGETLVINDVEDGGAKIVGMMPYPDFKYRMPIDDSFGPCAGNPFDRLGGNRYVPKRMPMVACPNAPQENSIWRFGAAMEVDTVSKVFVADQVEQTYSIENVNFECEILEFDDTFYQAFEVSLNQGITIPYTTFTDHVFAHTGTTADIQVAERVKSAKSVIAVMRRLKDLNTPEYSKFAFTQNGLKEYQFKIGTQYFPSQPIVTDPNALKDKYNTQRLMELAKIINSMSDVSHDMDMCTKNWTQKYMFGVDLDKEFNRLSGLDTTKGLPLFIKMQHSNGLPCLLNVFVNYDMFIDLFPGELIEILN